MRGRRFRQSLIAALVAATVAACTGTPHGQSTFVPVRIMGSCASDTVPPAVSHVRFSHPRVDVTGQPAGVLVEATVTDGAGPGVRPTGVARVTAQLAISAPVGTVRRVSLHRSAGTSTWTGRLSVPQDHSPGTWMVTAVQASDSAGNSSSTHDRRTWRPELTVISRMPDTKPPIIRSLSVSPRWVDTRRSPARINVRLRATDDAAVESASVKIYTDENEEGVDPAAKMAHLTPRGKDLFTGTIRMPRWQYSGHWEVVASASDGVNEVGPPEFRFPGIEVVSGMDKRAPIIRTIHADLAEIDVRRHSQHIPLSMHLVDLESGIATAKLDLYGPRAPQPPEVSPYPVVIGMKLRLTSGSASDGWWTGELTLPRCTPDGDYDGTLAVTDISGRQRLLESDGNGWAAVGLPSPVRVVSRRTDWRPPVPSLHRRSPQHFEVRFDEGVINVTKENLHFVDIGPTRSHPQYDLECQDRAKRTVSCSGRDGLVERAVLRLKPIDKPLRTFLWRLLPNVWGASPQITDRVGNPVSSHIRRPG